MTFKPIESITVFRSPLSNWQANEWRIYFDHDRVYSFAIFNPSGQPLIDSEYEGQGESRAITKAQAAGDKADTLKNCALYTARNVCKRRGWDLSPNPSITVSLG